MAIIDLIQGSQDWLDYRQGRIMATDASVIAESNPFKTALELWEEKLGLREPQKVNEAMLRGQKLEPEAREIASIEIGLEFEPCVFESEAYSWAAASLDGLYLKLNRILEIKCPKEKTHKQALDNIIPEYYTDQMQWQMLVCESEIGYYFSYCPEYKDKPFQIIEVMADQYRQAVLLSKCQEFYIKLCTMQPPLPWVFTA